MAQDKARQEMLERIAALCAAALGGKEGMAAHIDRREAAKARKASRIGAKS